MNVKDLMTKDVSCVQASDSIQRAAQAMKAVNCGAIPVCESNKVIGMVTDRDIVLRCLAEGNTGATVSDCMSTDVVTCTPETDAHEAADLMARNKIRRLPVVDNNGNICGICSIGDLATINIHVNEAGDALSKISEPTESQRTVH